MSLKRILGMGSRVARGLLTPGSLSTLVLLVTDECNARCPYCFNTGVRRPGAAAPAGGGGPLRLEEHQRIAGNVGSLYQLIVGGGEPFLRRDLVDIVDAYCRHADARLVSIPTNGAFGERTVAFAETLAGRYPHTTFNVMISLDAEADAHDRLRGVPGLYNAAIELGHELIRLRRRRSNLNFVVNSVITTETKSEIAALTTALRTTYSADFRYHNLQIDQRLGADRDVDVGDIEALRAAATHGSEVRGTLERLVDRAYVQTVEDLLLRQARAKRQLLYCNAGRKIMVILEDGTVTACEPFAFEARYHHLPRFQIRDFEFNPHRLRGEPRFTELLEFIDERRCAACPWSCAAVSSILFQPKNWPRVAETALRRVAF